MVSEADALVSCLFVRQEGAEMYGRCSWFGLRDIDVSRLRLSRRARKARSHVDLDPEFSSLSRYMSKIFGLERHDDTTFCRRSAGKVGTTLSNGRHTCRTCTRCHSGNACASRDGIHARRHLFIAGIFVGSFSRAAFS